MISISRRMLTYVVACVLISSTSCTDSAKGPPEAPPVQALRVLYKNNEKFRTTLDKAFANMQNPDPKTVHLWKYPNDNSPKDNPWKDKRFDDLCEFFNDWYYLKPINDDEKFDEFAYIKKFAWFYYENKFGQEIVGKEPGLSWSKDFVVARGKFMDSEESVATIPQWIDDLTIKEEYIVPSEGFKKSFNEFFVRDLQPGKRPIASPTDDSVMVAPTDCVLNMIDPLTPDTKIPTKLNHTLNVKELLNGSTYAQYFENGTAISCILLPHTYHHYHAVVSGNVVESREDVAGAYWGIDDFGAFFNSGHVGYGQSYGVFEQFRRGYVVIETEEHGYVAMIPVGLDTIGSVVFENKFKKVTQVEPEPVTKGDKLGHFAYGGSLVITLIQQGFSPIEISPNRILDIPLGQKIGVFKQKKSSASK